MANLKLAPLGLKESSACAAIMILKHWSHQLEYFNFTEDTEMPSLHSPQKNKQFKLFAMELQKY